MAPPTEQTTQASHETAATRLGTLPRQRQRNDESWVEVSSHPSSSSVSSIGDEIVTTGLRVGSSAYAARRRRLHPQSYNHLFAQQQQRNTAPSSGQAGQGGTSSQEEYEESETDSDHVLTSSTENFTSVPSRTPTPLRNVYPVDKDSSDEDEDDENATALGTRRGSESFRPQPNAFSHPPSRLQHRHSTSSSIPNHHPHPSFSQRSSTRIDRRSANFMSPSYREDNDAALRASLTTLLSCAAAARALNKDGDKDIAERAGPSSGQPVNLLLVPESDLMDPNPRPTAQGRVLRADPPSPPPPATTSREAGVGGEKIKRAATPTQSGKSPRASKKKKTNLSVVDDALISPTLMTWVVSAGVVVLVSVVGFGAGYVIGREVGRQENLSSLGAGNASSIADSTSCGREVIRSGGGTLKRFRWGSGMGRSIVAS